MASEQNQGMGKKSLFKITQANHSLGFLDMEQDTAWEAGQQIGFSLGTTHVSSDPATLSHAPDSPSILTDIPHPTS